ncbi:hypothetical protein HDC94_002129 [Leifsonia sp. AK011]|uniref:hypothetical protein n=1 Tax=Leifsonia sp. AK011 TaxID=2723075 RepID=UPI0015C929DC|nr:hypothetical protein [Leifsonia sp. AK011]NYF10973.1 hypothetical protein [Leifsonia sp. AK011]
MRYPQTLGQVPWLRPAALIPGALFVWGAVALFVEDGFPWDALMGFALLATVGVILSLRLWRMCVMLHENRIVVRGFFWSRTIPRERVLRVSNFGWLISRTRSGRPWATPIAVFWNFGSVPLWFESHNAAALIRISRWIERRENRPARHREFD